MTFVEVDKGDPFTEQHGLFKHAECDALEVSITQETQSSMVLPSRVRQISYSESYEPFRVYPGWFLEKEQHQASFSADQTILDMFKDQDLILKCQLDYLYYQKEYEQAFRLSAQHLRNRLAEHGKQRPQMSKELAEIFLLSFSKLFAGKELSDFDKDRSFAMSLLEKDSTLEDLFGMCKSNPGICIILNKVYAICGDNEKGAQWLEELARRRIKNSNNNMTPKIPIE